MPGDTLCSSPRGGEPQDTLVKGAHQHHGAIPGLAFMIIVDAYSKWLEVVLMPSTTADAVIKALLKLLMTHGLPDILVFDNGLQFTANHLKTFLASHGICHALVTPFHPASNRQAERMVQSAKDSC